MASHKIPYEQTSDASILQNWIINREMELIPPDCPDQYREIIRSCWSQSETRPSASDICKMLVKTRESCADSFYPTLPRKQSGQAVSSAPSPSALSTLVPSHLD